MRGLEAICNTDVPRDLRAKVTESHLIDSRVIHVEKKTLYSCFGKIICEIRRLCDGGRNASSSSVLEAECALSAPVLAWLCLSCPCAQCCAQWLSGAPKSPREY